MSGFYFCKMKCACLQEKLIASLCFLTQGGQNIGVNRIPPTQCDNWVRTSNGGHFASPNYPNMYPPNQECIYILEGTCCISGLSYCNLPSNGPSWTVEAVLFDSAVKYCTAIWWYSQFYSPLGEHGAKSAVQSNNNKLIANTNIGELAIWNKTYPHSQKKQHLIYCNLWR